MESSVTNKTVLLVDDEIDFCHLIGQVLEQQGFKVVIAHTLETARVQLIASQPSIVLLDHHLPDGIGTEFLETNRAELQHRYVIYITADSSSLLRDQTTHLGVFDFLPKPFHPSALNKIIYLAATFN